MKKEQVAAIERGSGFGMGDDIGGLPKKLYYTPDGRRILAVEAIRDYVVKDKNGKVISQGKRDANLDIWLSSPPEHPNPYCRGCDRWHDTQAEVDTCIRKQEAFIRSMKKKARDEQIEAKDEELAKLSKQVEELSRQVQALLLLKT